MLKVGDEFTYECLAILVARKLKAIDVIDVLCDLLILRKVPGGTRLNNGPEFVLNSAQAWITGVDGKAAYLISGSPWENGYIKSFHTRLQDEILNGEIVYNLKEAPTVIDSPR